MKTPQSLLVVLIDVLIYVLHASFTEGWKCDFLVGHTVSLWPDVANKTNGGNSHPRVNEGTFIREYSTIRPIWHISLQSFQCPFGNWPDFLVLSYKSPFVKSWVRNFMLSKRRFWKDEQKMKSGVSTDFSTIRSPKRALTPLKSASNIRISSFVHPSKNLRLGWIKFRHLFCSP